MEQHEDMEDGSQPDTLQVGTPHELSGPNIGNAQAADNQN